MKDELSTLCEALYKKNSSEHAIFNEIAQKHS